MELVLRELLHRVGAIVNYCLLDEISPLAANTHYTTVHFRFDYEAVKQ